MQTVIERGDEPVSFKNLKEGDIFESGTTIAMKCREVDEYNAVILHQMEEGDHFIPVGHLSFWSSYSEVIRVKTVTYRI